MLRRLFYATALAAAISTSYAYAQVAVDPAAGAASLEDLRARAQRAGTARVIVEFAEPGVALDGRAGSDEAYVRAVRRTQQSIIADVFGPAARMSGADRALTLMDYSPMFAVNVTAAELARLARDPRVVRIHEDRLDQPSLLQSLGLIKMTGAAGAYSVGAEGAGRAVAVLDTGVNKVHEFLKNKVISEACYNTTNPSFQSTSRCPGGAGSSTAAGSGADCASTITGCGHGTHVAGIAAGRNTAFNAGEPQNGVARLASVVAINVFSRFNRASGNCGAGATQDCVLSFTSDQIKALERVFALRRGVANRRIDSVNMSLGGGGFVGFCNTDSRKPIIDKLRNAGIATVIASGNSSFVNGVGAPGCISTAITVGASTKKGRGKPERMSSFTNQGPQVDTLAPGGDFTYPNNNGKDPILSSRFNGYAFLSGTSMAAPHVAGAIAAIRSNAPCRTKTVGQIENALHTTGLLIKDHRVANPPLPQLSERRMDVPAVMRKLGCFS
jgi:subtilisin family serine protease